MKRIIFIVILVLIVAIILFFGYSKYKQGKIDVPEQTLYSATLFFSDGGLSLVKEQRQIQIKSNETVEKKVLEELIKGTNVEGYRATVSPATKINSIIVQNGTATVDLSEEFITNHSGGAESENLTVFSVVNTLTDIKNINKVKFLINGQTGKGFSHMGLEGVFEADDSLVKQ